MCTGSGRRGFFRPPLLGKAIPVVEGVTGSMKLVFPQYRADLDAFRHRAEPAPLSALGVEEHSVGLRIVENKDEEKVDSLTRSKSSDSSAFQRSADREGHPSRIITGRASSAVTKPDVNHCLTSSADAGTLVCFVRPVARV